MWTSNEASSWPFFFFGEGGVTVGKYRGILVADVYYFCHTLQWELLPRAKVLPRLDIYIAPKP